MSGITRHFVRRAGLALLLLGAPALGQTAGWRGDGSGRYPKAQPPTAWDIDAETGILWQAKVGKGQSSPVVAAGRVFVTAEKDLLVCLDAAGGKVLWKADNGYASLPPGIERPKKRPRIDPSCGYATPTPVSDGKHVWAVYGTGVVACFDPDGKRRWTGLLNREQRTLYGRTSSPVLVAGKLIVCVGGLVALDPASGKTLWETNEVGPYYGTPAVTRIGPVDVLITPAGDCVRVSDGKLLARELGEMEFTSPLVHAGVVYFADDPAVAWRLPGEPGETVEFQKLWEVETEGTFYASPVWHKGILYFVNNEGVLFALDAVAGKTLFRKELEIPSAGGRPGIEAANVYASPTIAGGHLLVANDFGDTLVLVPGRKYQETAHNYLDAGSGASPVAEGRRLFVRGGTKLYCLGRR